jgi:uncharacterized DUF497 family protein
MDFEWDPKKAAANQKKHGIAFSEAATVFGDPLAITFMDPDHSINEQRYITFGRSDNNHLLVIAHAESGNRVRIISTRRMTRRERRIYEEG